MLPGQLFATTSNDDHKKHTTRFAWKSLDLGHHTSASAAYRKRLQDTAGLPKSSHLKNPIHSGDPAHPTHPVHPKHPTHPSSPIHVHMGADPSCGIGNSRYPESSSGSQSTASSIMTPSRMVYHPPVPAQQWRNRRLLQEWTGQQLLRSSAEERKESLLALTMPRKNPAALVEFLLGRVKRLEDQRKHLQKARARQLSRLTMLEQELDQVKERERLMEAKWKTVQERYDAQASVLARAQRRAEDSERRCGGVAKQLQDTEERLQRLEKRIQAEMDSRLSRAARDQFNSLTDFPHNQEIANHYKILMTDVRISALDCIEEDLLTATDAKVDAIKAICCLELLVQRCFGWVINHELPHYERTLQALFGSPLHEEQVEHKEHKDKEHKEHKEHKGPIVEALRTLVEKSSYTYRKSASQKSSKAGFSDIRQWLLVLLRKMHKAHVSPERLESDAKLMWSEVAHAFLLPVPEVLPEPIVKYITGLLSVSWEIVLAVPSLELIAPPPPDPDHYHVMHGFEMPLIARDKEDLDQAIHPWIAFPPLVTSEGDILVPGEVFFPKSPSPSVQTCS